MQRSQDVLESADVEVRPLMGQVRPRLEGESKGREMSEIPLQP